MEVGETFFVATGSEEERFYPPEFPVIAKPGHRDEILTIDAFFRNPELLAPPPYTRYEQVTKTAAGVWWKRIE